VRRNTASRRRGHKKKGGKVSLFWKFLLCIGVILAIMLYIHLRQPSPSFTSRVKTVDQIILAQLSQRKITEQAIQKREEELKRKNTSWTLTRWEITLPSGVEAKNTSSHLIKKIQDACAGVAFTESRNQTGAWELHVKVDDLLVHHLIFHSPKLKPLPPRLPQPRIAIVVDDLGANEQVTEELLRLETPLTFSILPLQPFSRRIAKKAHNQGIEVILHLPMEPRGFPLKNPGKGALFVSMSTKELLRQLRKDLDAVPFITGVNNHMGSRFMEHNDKVKIVLQELKKQGFFFLDSRTSAKSTGYQIAQMLGMRAGERDLFLDNEADVQAIRVQLEQLIKTARDKRTAIGICHPYPSTITALKEMVPKIKIDGIQIVPLSKALD
jgi:polysaccharide deacetylase 2 family uncharacterized protein YibQ